MKKQQGFGVAGIIIIVLAVVIVGVISWRLYDASKGKSNNQTSNSQGDQNGSKSGSQPVDAYAGWKTYTASLAKYSFRYPANWTASPTTSSDLEAVTLTAPVTTINGEAYQFSLMFRIFKPLGIGVNSYSIFSATNLQGSNFTGSLFSVVTGADDAPGSFSYGKAGYLYASSTSYPAGKLLNQDITVSTNMSSGQEVEFVGNYAKVANNTVAYFDPAQFGGLSDVQTSNKIFKSLTNK